MLLSSGILKFHADFWIVISNNIFQAYESDPTALSPQHVAFQLWQNYSLRLLEHAGCCSFATDGEKSWGVLLYSQLLHCSAKMLHFSLPNKIKKNVKNKIGFIISLQKSSNNYSCRHSNQ